MAISPDNVGRLTYEAFQKKLQEIYKTKNIYPFEQPWENVSDGYKNAWIAAGQAAYYASTLWPNLE